jgi:hypothetical protein
MGNKNMLNEELSKIKGLMNFMGENIINENEMSLEEADTTIMGGVAKNLYLDLKKQPINTPLDKEGKPMMNIKGEPIEYKQKVSMYYQNDSLGKLGKSIDINSKDFSEITIHYNVYYIHVIGFPTKQEAEKVLQDVLSKYPDQMSGEVKFVESGSGFADRYSIVVRLNQQSSRSLYNPNTYSYSARPNSNDRKRMANG